MKLWGKYCQIILPRSGANPSLFSLSFLAKSDYSPCGFVRKFTGSRKLLLLFCTLITLIWLCLGSLLHGSTLRPRFTSLRKSNALLCKTQILRQWTTLSKTHSSRLWRGRRKQRVTKPWSWTDPPWSPRKTRKENALNAPTAIQRCTRRTSAHTLSTAPVLKNNNKNDLLPRVWYELVSFTRPEKTEYWLENEL